MSKSGDTINISISTFDIDVHNFEGIFGVALKHDHFFFLRGDLNKLVTITNKTIRFPRRYRKYNQENFCGDCGSTWYYYYVNNTIMPQGSYSCPNKIK